MSQLQSILNPESARRQQPTLVVEVSAMRDGDQGSTSPNHMSASPEESDEDEVDELDDESEVGDDQEGSGSGDALAEEGSTCPSDPAANPQADQRTKKKTRASRRKYKDTQPGSRRKTEKHDKKIDLGLHDHKAHADCPDTLACLPDTTGRPQHTLPVILRCAILGSPRQRLTIREIYASMEAKYPYYKNAGQTWKQSVRHHLSLNRLFERQPRPVSDPGFGSYWTVNLAAPPGTKRPRKRGRPKQDVADDPDMVHEPGSSNGHALSTKSGVPTKFQFQPQTHPPPPLPPLPQPTINSLSPHSPPSSTPSNRTQTAQLESTTVKLSYPPAVAPTAQVRIIQPVHSSNPSQAINHVSSNTINIASSISPRSHAPMESRTRQTYSYNPQQYYQEHYGQGSPEYPKPATPLTPVSGAGSAYPPSSSGNESDSDRVMAQDERSHSPMMSEDNYESEDEMDRYRGPPSPRTAQREYIMFRPVLPVVSLPPFSTLHNSKEDIVDRLREEIASLRKSNADGTSTNLRLTEQLTSANLEISRARGVVRDLEDRLRNEQSKRVEVERLLELERRCGDLSINKLPHHATGRSSSQRPT